MHLLFVTGFLGFGKTTPILGCRALRKRRAELPTRQAAWYPKAVPIFSDTLAFVRQHLWPVTFFCMSSAKPDMVEIPRTLFERMTDTLAFPT